MNESIAMYGAIARNEFEVVRGLVARDPSLTHGSFMDKSWLHWAAMLGRIEIMEILAESGAAVDGTTCDGDCSTPLEVAAGQGRYAACEWLLDRSADIDHGLGRHATPIFGAVFGKSLELVRLFVQRGADLRATFGEPKIDLIRYAERYGTPEILEYLRGCSTSRTARDEAVNPQGISAES